MEYQATRMKNIEQEYPMAILGHIETRDTMFCR